MMLNFNAIDVETANADRESICQIGIVRVQDGKIEDQWQTLINPETWFDLWNIDIHGITQKDVQNSPALPEIRTELRKRLRGSVVISHSSFDRVAFERAMLRYNLEQLQVTWLDSTKIVRRAWPENYGKSGYGLKNVAKDLGISFRHHDALQDAKALAEIVIQACRSSEIDIDGWLERVKQPIFTTNTKLTITREGRTSGPLFGEVIVFTGKLAIKRQEAADLAASAGCMVTGSINNKVTLLVVGTQNMNVLNGYPKSSKHRRAEELVAQGNEIQILSENDFYELIHLS